jgi:hypothetical protein
MAKSPKSGFLKISISHGSIFQKEKVSRPWNCVPFCKRENPDSKLEKEPETSKKLVFAL